MVQKKPGFTLIEIMIVLCIGIIALGIVNSIFISGNRVFNDADVKSTLQMEAKDIEEKVSDIGMQGLEVIEVNYFAECGKKGTINKLFLKSFQGDSEEVFLIEHKKDGDKNKFQISTITIKDKASSDISKEDLKNDKNKDNYTRDLDKQRVFSENIENIYIIEINGKTNLAEELKDSNGEEKKNKIRQINSIKLKIVLNKKKGFAQVTYPFEFTVTLRNSQVLK